MTIRYNLEKTVVRNILIAMNYVDNAFMAIELCLKEEFNLESERNDLYTYGLTDAHIHKAKLLGVKKALKCITGNLKYKDAGKHEKQIEENIPLNVYPNII